MSCCYENNEYKTIIKIKTITDPIINCEDRIRGLSSGTLAIDDSLTLEDIYGLINTNDYIITTRHTFGEGGSQYIDILINCKQIVSVEKYL